MAFAHQVISMNDEAAHDHLLDHLHGHLVCQIAEGMANESPDGPACRLDLANDQKAVVLHAVVHASPAAAEQAAHVYHLAEVDLFHASSPALHAGLAGNPGGDWNLQQVAMEEAAVDVVASVTPDVDLGLARSPLVVIEIAQESRVFEAAKHRDASKASCVPSGNGCASEKSSCVEETDSGAVESGAAKASDEICPCPLSPSQTS